MLILAFVFVICLQVLKVSYKRSYNQRDKKGKVSRMKVMTVSFGGRSAASLAATYSTFVSGLVLSGGSGSVQQTTYASGFGMDSEAWSGLVDG